MITLCDRCYQAYGEDEVDQHGLGLCPFEARREAGTAFFKDEIPGGQWFENYGPKPVKFYSHSERLRYMKEHGIRQKEKFCPTPGTDIDPAGIPNPKGYIDAQTMENARILLSRVSRAPAVEEEPSNLLRGQFNIVDGGNDAQKFMNGDVRRAARLGRRMANAQESVDTNR